jgi:hypothetical protein
MDVKEWMSYKCSDEGTGNHNIHNSSTHSHPSEEDRTKNCKCKRAFRGGVGSDDDGDDGEGDDSESDDGSCNGDDDGNDKDGGCMMIIETLRF